MYNKKEIYEHRACKDCGRPFFITVEEKKFYESRIDEKTGESLKLPVRCYFCRKGIREARGQGTTYAET